MPSLFASDEDLINLTVHYTFTINKKGANFVKVLNEEQAKAMLQDPKKADAVKTLNAKARQQTWAMQQRLFAESSVYNPAKGEKETDFALFTDFQLKSAIVDWDATDPDGRSYPVTPELIDQLPAAIANELIIQYRKAISTEDGEGNE